MPNFISLVKTIYPRVLTKPLLDDAKSPLPVDVRRSKTPLLKFPTEEWGMLGVVRLQYKKVIKS